MTADFADSQTDPPTSPTKRSWGLRDAIGSLVGFIVLSLGGGFTLAAVGVDVVTATILATPIGWLALGGWPVIATRRRGAGVRVDLALAFRPIDIGYGLLAALVVFGATAIFLAVYVTVTDDVPTSAIGDVAEASTQPWQILLLILLALGAAVVEEVHFRGLWWQALRRRGLGRWPTLLVTSVIFSLIHFELARAPLLLAAGLAAGFVRMVTGRLGPAIITHLVINGVGTLGLWAML